MRALKYEFIEKYIFPLLKPFEDFFGKYGIDRVTVTMVPVLIIVLFTIRSEVNRKSNKMLIIYIFGVVLILIAIIKYQFLYSDVN